MSVFSKFKDIFQSPYSNNAATGLYVTIIQQSRLPIFYQEFEVADTIDGRFDMVALHTYMVLRTLRRDPEETKELSQAVFDIMFADMDQNLRELSIGDTGVGKRMTKMVEGFYGRMAAYDLTLNMKDEDQKTAEMQKVVLRNIYRKTLMSDESVSEMSTYIIQQMQDLEQQDLSVIIEGNISFTSPSYTKASSVKEGEHLS